jgi:transposase-like protein
MRTSVSRYHRHRFPIEIISHCVRLYFRFPLSLRDVEEMLAMRGVYRQMMKSRFAAWELVVGAQDAN